MENWIKYQSYKNVTKFFFNETERHNIWCRKYITSLKFVWNKKIISIQSDNLHKNVFSDDVANGVGAWIVFYNWDIQIVVTPNIQVANASLGFLYVNTTCCTLDMKKVDLLSFSSLKHASDLYFVKIEFNKYTRKLNDLRKIDVKNSHSCY